jgi:uncharacterized protein (UPF0261 family)
MKVMGFGSVVHSEIRILKRGKTNMKNKPGVLLIATMDTKADEAIYIEKCLQKEGVSVVIMDPGIRGRSPHKVGISRGKVARTAGKTLKEVRAVGNEAKALNMMIPGAIKCAQNLTFS